MLSIFDIDWHTEIVQDFAALVAGWQIKATLSAALTVIVVGLDLNLPLLLLASGLLLFESCLRIALQLKRKRETMCRVLQRCVARFCYYFLTVSLAIFVQSTVQLSYHFDLPVIDWILGCLMLTDCASCTSLLRLLGYQPPKLLTTLIQFLPQVLNKANEQKMANKTENILKK